MSSDYNRTRMTHMARAVFTTSSLNFGLQTYLVYTIATEGHYMLCSINYIFFKTVEQSCLKWCGKRHVKGRTYLHVYRVDTVFVLLASSVSISSL